MPQMGGLVHEQQHAALEVRSLIGSCILGVETAWVAPDATARCHDFDGNHVHKYKEGARGPQDHAWLARLGDTSCHIHSRLKLSCKRIAIIQHCCFLCR
jgi:hypothetical protein